MRAGKSTEKAAVQINFGFAPGVRIDAIGGKGLHAAQLPPVVKDGRVLEEIFHHRLVVAAQANRAVSNEPDSQQIDDGFRLRAAIDVVPQIDLDRACDRPASDVIINASNDLAQQIGAAMDIANRIDARASRR